MSNSILVTGATGTIGAQLVKVLKTKEADFAAMVRDEHKAKKLETLGVRPVIGDFDDNASLSRALEGFDKLFLLTPPVQNQGQWHVSALNAARTVGIKHIVKVSAYGSDANSSISLIREHGISDQEIVNSGLSWTILLPFSFMQNYLASIPTINNGQLFGSTGQLKVPYVDARDVADIAAAILGGTMHKNSSFTITGPEPLDGASVASALSAGLSRDVAFINVPFEASRAGMLQAGFPPWLVDDLVKMTKSWMEGPLPVSDSTEIILGKPGRDIHTFIRDHLFLF